MASKNPIGRLADTAIGTLKNPLGTAGRVVEQAKGTAALGRMVAEQVGKSAVSKATDTAGAVLGVATGRRPGRTETYAPQEQQDVSLRPVPDVNQPAHTPAENEGQAPEAEATAAATRPVARRAARPVQKAARTVEKAADSVEQAAAAVDAPTKKAATSKAPAKKTPASEAPAKKAPASGAPAKKTPATKAAAKKTARKAPAAKVTATPADVAEVVESAVAEDPSKTAATKATTPAKKAAAKKVTKKATARKSTPGDRLPRKATGSGNDPKSAEQLATLEGTDVVTTPAGIPAADSGTNPDTTEKELTQPGTEGLVDESTANAVASESAMMRKAAEQNPE